MIDIMECAICKKLKKANIVVLDRNICEECEIKLINTKADDSTYEIYKNSIKEIITSVNVH